MINSALSLFTVATLFLQDPSERAEPWDKITICEALQNPQKWNGKPVWIESPIKLHSRAILDGSICPDVIEANGRKFVKNVWIAMTQKERTLTKIYFETSITSYGRLEGALELAAQLGLNLTAAMVGILETQKDINDLYEPTRKMVRGFGEQGQYPMQLVLYQVAWIKPVK